MADSYPNPLVMQRADPWIHLHSDGYYYFIATVPEYDRIELRRAKTIQELASAEPHTIWEKHSSGPMSHHIWAPEIHFANGKWYIYFAAGEADDIWRIRMYVLECTASNPLAGNWIEKGEIKTQWDSFSLDATRFEHNENTYLVWAQQDPKIESNTNLYISKMDTPWSLTGPQVMITTPDYDWEKQLYKVNEGAAVLKRNGRIFITYSASGTDHNYCMGLLWANDKADLLDPAQWSKSPTPVFSSSDDFAIFGPGHNSFTTDENDGDILVYHARNYKEIAGNPLKDPNRHTRVQSFSWTKEGFPEFTTSLPDSQPAAAPKPLYRDPVFDGAADPVVLWNPHRARWWMFYTNRRANADELSGVAWVHGTHIGIAESSDGGITWNHHGQIEVDLPDELQIKNPTHWAPEVITGPNGTHHMYLTFVPGVFENWNHPREILHLTSFNLQKWTYQSTLELATNKVIDACVARLPDGNWRMWYNNERDGKSIYYADSTDLYNWTDGNKVTGDRAGEGPKVVFWKNYYWMVTDVWHGLGVYRSNDAVNWTRQTGENLLQHPGAGEDDGVKGSHPDIVVQGDKAYLFYFTHPGRISESQEDGYSQRRSSIQVVELKFEDGNLQADRNQPTHLKLDPR